MIMASRARSLQRDGLVTDPVGLAARGGLSDRPIRMMILEVARSGRLLVLPT